MRFQLKGQFDPGVTRTSSDSHEIRLSFKLLTNVFQKTFVVCDDEYPLLHHSRIW
jgi:hypothetical protein